MASYRPRSRVEVPSSLLPLFFWSGQTWNEMNGESKPLKAYCEELA